MLHTLRAVVLLAALVAGGCSLFEGDTEVRSVPVEAFDLTERSGLSVRFLVTGQWRNTCGEFSRFETSREGATYTVTMYGEQRVGATCGQAFSPISGEWAAEVPEAGSYTFRFLRGDATPLDTTLTF
jgi:hypothetical protein